MIVVLPLILSLVHSETPWQPYCPWSNPGINKTLYSCDNYEQAQPPNNLKSSTNKREVKVGLLFPQTPSSCTYIDLYNQGIPVEIALEDINADETLIPGFQLKLVTAPDYKSCGRTFDTLGYAYTLRVEQKVEILIGPVCGDGSSGPSVASFAASENMPVISVAAFEDELNDVAKYPTFTRIYESVTIQAYYQAAVYDYFGWREVVAVVQQERGPTCTIKWANQVAELRKMGYTVKPFNMRQNNTLEKSRMEEILQYNRIVSLFGSPSVIRAVSLALYRVCSSLSWCSWSDYRLLAVNFRIGLTVSNEQILPWSCDQSVRVEIRTKLCTCCTDEDKEEDDEARQAFKSMIYIVSDVRKFSQQDRLFCEVMKRILASPYITRKPSCTENVYLVQHVYDTILLYAHALNVTQDPTDGRRIADVIKSLGNIRGKSGRIVTNLNGSRYSDMLAYFLLQDDDQEMTSVLRLSPNRETGLYRGILLPGKREPVRISDTPPCSWYDISCPQPMALLITAVVVVIVSIGALTLVKIWLHKKRGPRQSFVLTTELLAKVIADNAEGYKKNIKRVHVSTTNAKVTPHDRKVISLLRELHHIQHSNILELMHCYPASTGLVLVTELCQKGNLQQLITTERRVQSASFIRSFAVDILEGLSYLHGSSFGFHGSLTSLNCLVDGNWTLKLKGFHLRHLQRTEVYYNEIQGVEFKGGLDNVKRQYKKLWMSPEVISGQAIGPIAQRANDVYSFGVILAELINCEAPFGITWSEHLDQKKLQEQINRIMNGEKPLKDEAPDKDDSSDSDTTSTTSDKSTTSGSEKSISSLSNQANSSASCKTYDSLASLRKASAISGDFREEGDMMVVKQYCLLCTQSEPDDRPTVKEILTRLETGSQQFVGTLVDQWLVTLEKKSKELKSLFEVRNKDFLKEKERTKELVYSLLPREIAEQKMMGTAVAPQVFSNCSFFYSDIKGFTSIVADLTNLEDGGPMDVVDMLDNLYTIMDRAIGKYSVVKVETIGDAYVVVSGLPVPDINGSAHAKNIAGFALEVLSTTKDITVKRLEDRPVYMRIGIHSGSCVAGVAGSTMFHYCIYGKEPRYANSLESSGEASRIQMSNEMRVILEKQYPNKFAFVERKPAVLIQNKTRRTWWLTGEAGVYRDMPDDSIYKKLEFRRKISNTTNPMLLKGIQKLRSEVSGHSSTPKSRTQSSSSAKSKKSDQKKKRSDAKSELSSSTKNSSK